MKGFVPTPSPLVDRMVAKLFRNRPPWESATLLDPGCGAGPFIEGVLRWCARTGAPVPSITGIELDPVRLSEASAKLDDATQVTLLAEDFLRPRPTTFDFIIGNPPYVSLMGLDSTERERYRELYNSATGRFDLYLLFFEQAMKLLRPGGRLVFVTPEKFMYVQAAATLRQELAVAGVEEIELVDEGTFPGLVTYPAITTLAVGKPVGPTKVITRDGTARDVSLNPTGASWLPDITGSRGPGTRWTLLDAFDRISCGVATGADSVYVVPGEDLPSTLVGHAHPTISGRELAPGGEAHTKNVMLVPYTRDGELIPESGLGPLRTYLEQPDRRARLLARTCVARKPWYAFHETPPLGEILRPKLLCKDIGPRPWFTSDDTGTIVPRHSIYYLVPKDPGRLHDLCDYLNSEAVTQYLMANCQRAANGFIRLQSHVLKKVPLPERLVADHELALT